MNEALLQVEAVDAGYGAVQVLRDLSIAAQDQTVTALIGANGAGKTTLMRAIAGLLPLRAGRIRFNGEDVSQWPSSRRVEAGLVLVPEGRLVFNNLSVAENLRLGAITPRARGRWRARQDEMFELFPILRERQTQAAGTLSGGEQQMLAIARALMASPRLLLLDEPTLGLAPAICKQVFTLLRTLNDGGLAVLLSEQDVYSSLTLARQAYVMENGRIVAAGAGATLREDPRIKTAYLGL